MALTFYYLSGSPFAWRVWCALEHKKLDYERVTLSFSAGDNKKPEYLAINPRGKVPSLVDGDFKLYESDAIVEYLDERFPDGPALFPKDLQGRAIARRLIAETQNLYFAVRHIANELWTKPEADWNAAQIEEGRKQLLAEYERFESYLRGDFFTGSSPSAPDYAIFAFFATAQRLEKKKADLGLVSGRPPKLAAWVERFEALPIHDKTFPPHWR